MNSATNQLPDDFIQLARTALAGRPQDIHLLIHRASKKYKQSLPLMTEALISLLKESPSRSSPLRKLQDTPLPVDLDSRLQLLRIETTAPSHDPILSAENEKMVSQAIFERENIAALFRHGLHPTKSMLFNGPPGVGKTLTAKWIAAKLNKPLLILDLAAVMSSFLGRTGNNIRYVLDYAKKNDCVLLLDELDAIAKRRDDSGEIGELKRLVTVLLQEIDDWPSTGLLIAATNHPGLLDPAIWRRFDSVVKFGNPTRIQIELFVGKIIEGQIDNVGIWSSVLSYSLSGNSYSEVERQLTQARKSSAIFNKPLNEGIESLMSLNNNLSREEKIELACLLEESGIVSQRRAHEITGIARDTIRKHRIKHIDKTLAVRSNVNLLNNQRTKRNVVKKISKPLKKR